MQLDEFPEAIRLAGVKYAKAKGVATLAERMVKVVLAEIINQTDGPIGRAEHIARAHPKYREAIKTEADTQTEANVAYAEMEALRTRFEMWRTRSANKRAETRLA